MHLRIHDQRRRITFVVIATMSALWAGVGANPAIIVGGLAALAAVLAVLRFAPGWRNLTEAAAVGLLIVAPLPLPVPLLLVLATGFAGLAYLGFYGSWLDRAGVSMCLISQRTSWVAWPRANVWAALVPGAAHPDDYWTRTLVDFDHDPDDPETLYLRFTDPEQGMAEVTMSFLDCLPDQSCRYLLERDDPSGAEDMTIALALSDDDDGCLIRTRTVHDALRPRIALARWFDDRFGDELTGFATPLSVRRDWGFASASPAAPVYAKA